MNTMVKFSLCTLSDEELVKKVDKLTDEMFQKQEVPTRNIPAEPNNDYDLLVGELIVRFSNQVQAGVSLNFAETKKEYDRFFYLYQYTYASSPDILLVGNTTERLWKWLEQKLKDVSKISE